MPTETALIPELTTEIREALKRDQAHRFPDLKYFPKPGDDGKDVKLPVVLGNPSGACRMPKGARVSPAWGQKVAQTFGAGDAEWAPLVTECVLWPEPHVWAAWLQRWPALAESVRPALVKKYGGDTDLISEPTSDVEVPDAVATRAAGTTWMRFEPKGAVIDLVVKAPSSAQWAMFTEAMKQPDADHWTLALELATACVPASTMPVAEAFVRWPGLALLVDREASYLAGMASKYEEGEL
jgi:hypothetical protein